MTSRDASVVETDAKVMDLSKNVCRLVRYLYELYLYELDVPFQRY